MTGPATGAAAAPKVTAPKAPAAPDFVIDDHYGLALAMLAIGVAVGVGVYWLLTHVMVEDAQNGG